MNTLYFNIPKSSLGFSFFYNWIFISWIYSTTTVHERHLLSSKLVPFKLCQPLESTRKTNYVGQAKIATSKRKSTEEQLWELRDTIGYFAPHGLLSCAPQRREKNSREWRVPYLTGIPGMDLHLTTLANRSSCRLK